MKLDKEYWKTLTFTPHQFPEINCPVCKKGHLIFGKEKFNSDETKDSLFDRNNEEWEPYWIRYVFTAIFYCSNIKCGEKITCLGKGRVEESMIFNKSLDYWEETYTEVYTPLFFFPSLTIIPISKDYPIELTDQLISSFSHFFSDLTSCANKIRGCIEVLMDKLNVNKTEIRSGKRKKRSLHDRILAYKVQNSTVADHLLAIKWIGNFGSHVDDVTKDDILDAYQLLDYSLSIIFDNETKEIVKLTKHINKRKAPRSKTKSHKSL